MTCMCSHCRAGSTAGSPRSVGSLGVAWVDILMLMLGPEWAEAVVPWTVYCDP